MLYPKSTEEHLNPELFRNPTSEYRGVPFWAWNRELKEDQLLRQIDYFKEMGMGGYHIHARNGLATEYMGEEFMRLVRASHDKGAQNHMLTWLYDEDRYPSGMAGGLVTEGREDLALSYLLFTPYAYGEIPVEKRVSRAVETCKENGKLLGRWAVQLDSRGYLLSYRRLNAEEAASDGETLYHAYFERVAPQSWFNNRPSGNVMNPEAVDRFIEVTHECYRKALGEHFGKTVPGIFTDEPHFVAKGNMNFALPGEDIVTTYTDDFGETFAAAYGYDLLDKLPEIFWERADGALSQVRWHYNDHCAQRFTDAFCKRIGGWCGGNGILFTGHLMSERLLLGQTYAMSEAMRHYPAFGLPGIDILADGREYTTAKQTQSIVRQYSRPGMLSELYGVTDWSYDFRGHKLQGDWQAAMGVTVRVHHLTWVSMEGEAKRDYPASIGYQSPWFREYKLVEDYFSRLNTALTRGKAVCRIGVVHPIESYWLRFGPEEHTGAERKQREANFQNLSEWLLYSHLDFDYICESLLPSQCAQGAAPLRVGEMAYDVVLVPDCITLRSTTVERLEKFAAAGGHLVFAGRVPEYVDALPSSRVRVLAAKAITAQYNPTEIVNALEEARDVEVVSLNTGLRAEKLVYQMRQDGGGRWFFLCHGDQPDNADVPQADEIAVRLAGDWDVTLYDAMTGEIHPVEVRHNAGMTVINRTFWPHDSLLLRLEPCAARNAENADTRPAPSGKADPRKPIRLPLECPVTLSEPNVLVLDWAEFAVDGGAYEPEEEMLRIDTLLRERFGWERRDGMLCQPYAVKANRRYEHEITFRFKVMSRIEISGAKLALERAGDCRIRLNGADVSAPADGWYVDEDIHTVPLPPVKAGENTLEIAVPVGRRVGAEAFYLLGDFGVRVCGAKSELTEPVRSLCFGDHVGQGLPFYGGNVTYHLEVETEGDFTVTAANFRSPLLAVDVDGNRAGVIAWAPYSVPVSAAPGKHVVDITAFGNRYNTFGSIHNADLRFYFPGNPGAWRTQGSAWSREYRLKPTGILVSPVIEQEIQRKG